MHVTAFNLPPLRHVNCIAQALFVVVVVEVAFKVVAAIKLSQRIPVYCVGQIQEHVDAEKKPPFKQESKPHLQIGCWHIAGQ